MKSSVFIAATSALLAMAGPVEKRAVETEIVVEYYTVTVTGKPPAPTPSGIKARPHGPPQQQQPPVQQPKPTTAAPVVVVVTVTPEQEQPKPTKAPETLPAPAPPTGSKDSPSKGSSSSRSIEDQGFQDAALYHHNIHRSNHSAPEVTWDPTLAQWAENTANSCKFAHDMGQGGGGYGQNIALWGGTTGAKDLGSTGAVKMAATTMWYNGEFSNFLPSYYGTEPDVNGVHLWGHMSQLVWAASTKVGCSSVFCPRGTAYDNMDSWYTVCNYSPPGNFGGQYAENIHRPNGAPVLVV
ncbi:CAP domain-containing protein [Xylariaceae sp. FL0594]|nr:CAP domain-containing protein [Xylariaceae sp. FL0594]